MGAEQVFVNGVLLERGVDYTASTGTTVTGLTALVAGDIVTVSSPSAFNVANAIPKATVAAKGDLIVGNGASSITNLPVGADGTTLVANSSSATGVAWAGPNVGAGKNAIINGGMDFWQRGTSFTDVNVGNYNADRFMVNRSGDVAGMNISRSTDTATGFLYSMKWQRASGNTNTTATSLYYGVESQDSYKFAGQTATLSFYAKKGANYSGGNLSAIIGSGTAVDAKPYAYTTNVNSTTVALTTSWARYSITGTFASNIAQVFFSLGWTPTGTAGADDSVYVTGVQLEIGAVATPFSRAGGTLQGELAACQRYYWRTTPGLAYGQITNGWASGATNLLGQIPTKVTMRIAPTSVDYSTLCVTPDDGTVTAVSAATLKTNESTPDIVRVDFTSSGLTQYRPYMVLANNSTSAYLGFSAEL